MKFFHLSDLHLGLKLYNRDLLAEQKYVLAQVVEYAQREQPDAIVVAGDIYDKAIPAAEAMAVFDEFIVALTQAVPHCELMFISGNHDSAQRIDVYRTILAYQHIHMIGLPPQQEGEYIAQVTLSDAYGAVHFYLLPFVKPSTVKAITGTDAHGNNLSYDAAVKALLAREELNKAERNVLVSHQFYVPVGAEASEVERAESEIISVGNVDAVESSCLTAFDYAALGHIHKSMLVGSECYRYCGTPLPCSVSEAGQCKGVVCVTLGAKGSINTQILPLTPLHAVRKITGELEEVLLQSSDDYVSIELTDKVDLNIFDMQDRLRGAFPNLLEIMRRPQQKSNSSDLDSNSIASDLVRDPLSQCRAFLGEMDKETESILQEILNTVQEAR